MLKITQHNSGSCIGFLTGIEWEELKTYPSDQVFLSVPSLFPVLPLDKILKHPNVLMQEIISCIGGEGELRAK